MPYSLLYFFIHFIYAAIIVSYGSVHLPVGKTGKPDHQLITQQQPGSFNCRKTVCKVNVGKAVLWRNKTWCRFVTGQERIFPEPWAVIDLWE